MTKIFICNKSRINHHDACIVGNNFGDCYDRATYPIAALLLWSFGVPQPAINVLLETMETIRFFYEKDSVNRRHLMAGPMKSALPVMVRGMLLQVQVSRP